MGTRTGRSEQAEAPLVNEGAAEGLREAYRLVSRQARWSGDGERGFDVGEGHAWREGGKEAGMGSRSDPIHGFTSVDYKNQELDRGRGWGVHVAGDPAPPASFRTRSLGSTDPE
jgi:hypothetical protein